MKKFLPQIPLVYLITDGETDPQNFSLRLPKTLKIIETAVQAGVSLVQIREKTLPAKFILELSREAVSITRGSPTKLLINDRADIALAAGADGVHLTSNSIPTRVIRQYFPKDFIIGVSTHTLGKAKLARCEGADFAVFSPVFYSPNKGKPQGTAGLSKVCRALNPWPVVALGGIDETNFAETLDAGAKGVAAIRLFSDLKKIPEIIERIKNVRKSE